jgi:hypothetical protein
VAHGSQLELGMLHVDTEYTLWLDSDCFPVREWWLYELLAYDCDLVGAKANYDYPAASPLCCLFKTNLYKEYLARCPNRLNWTKIDDKIFDIGRYFTHLICRERNTHLIPITNNSYGLEDLGFCMHARWGSMRQIRNDKGNLDLKVQERRDEVLNNVNWLKRLNQKSWWEYENRNRW